MLVSRIIAEKGDGVVTVAPGTTVRDTAGTLKREGIGAAVVQDENGALAGIVSERDIVATIAEHGETALAMPVSGLMSRSVITCTRQSGTEELMERMTAGRIRHLPVVEDGSLVGIVSVGDVVKSVLSELKWQTDVLRQQVATAASWATDED